MSASTETPRRGPLRFLFRSTLGCFALCVGALLMLVLLAPTVLSPLAGGFAEGFLEGRYKGRFEIGAARLSWFSRQSLEDVRVLDPDGGEVATLTARAPSLVDLARGRGRDLGWLEVEARLKLVADDAGLSNLQRCLEPVEPAAERPEPGQDRERGDRRRRTERPPEYRLVVDLRCDELSWSDAHTRASGTPFVLRELVGRAQLAPGQPLELTLAGAVQAGEPGVLRVDAKIDDPFRITDLERPTPFHVDCELGGLPTALVDALAGQGGRLTRILGPSFRVRASGDGTSADGTLALDLESDHARLTVGGRVVGGTFETAASGAEPGARLALDLGPEWVDELTAAFLAPPVVETAVTENAGGDPALAASLFPRAGQRLELDLESLALPLAPLFAQAEERGDLVDALLRGLVARVRVRAGDWTWRAADGRRLALGGMAADLAVSAGDERGAKPFEVTLRGGVGAELPPSGTALDTPPGIEATVSGPDLTMLAAWLPGEPLIPLRVSGFARDMDSALIDGWIGAGPNLSAQGPLATLDFTVDLVQPAGAPLSATFAAGLATQLGESRVTGKASLPAASVLTGLGTWPAVEVEVLLEGAQPVLALLPSSALAMGDLAGLIGDRATVRFAHEGAAPRSGALELRCEAHAVRLELTARIEDGVLRVERGGKLVASLVPPADLVASALAGRLPPGAQLDLAAGERVALESTQFQADLSPWLGTGVATGASTGTEPIETADAVARVVRELEGLVSVRLPRIAYRHAASGTGAANAQATGAAAQPVEIADLALAVSFAAGEPVRARTTGVVKAVPPGRIDLDLSVANLPEVLAAAGAAAAPGVAAPAPVVQPQLHAEGTLTNFPTGLVDALAAQDGLLIDVLGPALDLKLTGDWPIATERPLSAHMSSSKAQVNLVANLNDGVLVAGEAGELDASVGLTPLFSERVLGKLLPMIVQMSKPSDAGPAVFKLRSFALPLDGDLAKLSGRIDVDLGAVDYSLLPGLDELVSRVGAGGAGGAGARGTAGRALLPPFTLVVDQGVVRADALPLMLGGHSVVFAGRYNLNEQRFNLSTEVPLRLLGKGVEKKLDDVREFLDGATGVPIELRGTFSSPKLRLGEDFLKNVVEGAAKQALDRGLGGLLDKLKKDG